MAMIPKIFTMLTAMDYAKQGRIEEWIHAFLQGEGDNIDLSDGLKLEQRFYIGPILMPLRLFNRCCGPEETMKYQVNAEHYHYIVTSMKKRFDEGWDMPPLILNYYEGVFELCDGNHRYDALIQSSRIEYPVIIWGTGEGDYLRFQKEYSEYLADEQR